MFKEVTVGEIKQISPDSKLFTFLLPSSSQKFGLAVGQHIILRAYVVSPKHPRGKTIKRKYTPTSPVYMVGKFEIPIKIYYPTETYPGGSLTTHLDKLKTGDKIEVSGPRGKYLYLGDGVVSIFYINLWFQLLHCFNGRIIKHFDKIGFIAGGSGIAPCFQYIQYIIENNENIELSIISANRTEADILLRDRLEEYQARQKLKVFYTLSEPHNEWNFGRGYVNEEMIKLYLPAPAQNVGIFYSGPKPMSRMLRKLLSDMGYPTSIKY